MIVPRVYERQRELRESLGVPPRSRSRTKMKQNSVLAFRLRGSRLSTNENSVGALCSRVLVDSCRGRHAESKERRKGKKEERERERAKRGYRRFVPDDHVSYRTCLTNPRDR